MNDTDMSVRRRLVPARHVLSMGTAIRVPAVLGLIALLAIPMAEVHTSSVAPRVKKLVIVGNDLIAVEGKGPPSQTIDVSYRLRRFSEDNDNNGLDFCGEWTDWHPLGSVTADAQGQWFVAGFDVQVYPSESGNQICNSGLLTEIQMDAPGSTIVMPVIDMMNVPNGQWNELNKNLEARVLNADMASLAIADGPNELVSDYGGIDVDEDSVNTCKWGYCGQTVTWQLASPFDFRAPFIYDDDFTFCGALGNCTFDEEYYDIVGVVTAHSDGGTALAITRTPRRAGLPMGPGFNVNVLIDGLPDCDGAFDFF